MAKSVTLADVTIATAIADRSASASDASLAAKYAAAVVLPTASKRHMAAVMAATIATVRYGGILLGAWCMVVGSVRLARYSVVLGSQPVAAWRTVGIAIQAAEKVSVPQPGVKFAAVRYCGAGRGSALDRKHGFCFNGFGPAIRLNRGAAGRRPAGCIGAAVEPLTVWCRRRPAGRK